MGCQSELSNQLSCKFQKSRAKLRLRGLNIVLIGFIAPTLAQAQTTAPNSPANPAPNPSAPESATPFKLPEPSSSARDLWANPSPAQSAPTPEQPLTLEAGILRVIPRSIAGYTAALQGNHAPLQNLQNHIDLQLIGLTEQTLLSAQSLPPSVVDTPTTETVIEPITAILHQVSLLGARLEALNSLFTTPIQSFISVNPDEIILAPEAEQIAIDIALAIDRYNQIVLAADLAQLDLLKTSEPFVQLGSQLKQLSIVLITLGTIPEPEVPVEEPEAPSANSPSANSPSANSPSANSTETTATSPEADAPTEVSNP